MERLNKRRKAQTLKLSEKEWRKAAQILLRTFPREVRDNIYGHLINGVSQRYTILKKNGSSQGRDPHFLTNRYMGAQFMNEISEYMYYNEHFYMQKFQGLKQCRSLGIFLEYGNLDSVVRPMDHLRSLSLDISFKSMSWNEHIKDTSIAAKELKSLVHVRYPKGFKLDLEVTSYMGSDMIEEKLYPIIDELKELGFHITTSILIYWDYSDADED